MAANHGEARPRIVHHARAEMPTGLVTFLFTDIEGSTKLWEAYPDDMKVALARHDAIMRDAIAANGGIVFKTIGDAFCAAFSHAPSALLAAVDAQRGLSEERWGATGPLRARMALHSGRTDERDGDYFGPTVNRVARLLATGHGGQILVSDDTRRLLHPDPPGETDLRDMGKHRLKDLARPEHVFQACAPGLPTEFKPLRSQPSPYPGAALAGSAAVLGVGSFRVMTRGSGESIGSALSPVGLYQGFKALIVELSTANEWLLLAVGSILFVVAAALSVARWRAARRVLRMQARQPSRVARWAVNQRAIAFIGGMALLVLGAWGYQQYLWRVALPIPDDAVGIALTREASAATVQDGLADALFSQGQAQRVVVREIPVRFDARDTPKAREIGRRIGAEAVIIYRLDTAADGTKSYVAYVVFTDPSVGLTVGDASDESMPAIGSPGAVQQPVQYKQSVPVPALRTDSLSSLINAAAGVIAYHDNHLRSAIKHLELALPARPDDPDAGIVAYHLGNAYSLDGQSDRANVTLQQAAQAYEQRRQQGEQLGPQDELILVQTYLELGRIASLDSQWDQALRWYDKAITFREDLLARKDGLERPSDVRATFARLYSLKADVYRYQGKTEDERFWSQRAADEMQALVDEADPGDAYPYVQRGATLFFSGDCVGARASFDRALQVDPDLRDAKVDAGLVALWQSEPTTAETYWRSLLANDPDDVVAWTLLANMATLAGLDSTYFDPTYFEQAEGYLREIVRIDPANADAHLQIASHVVMRAMALTLDSTALVNGDALTLAKSQAELPRDRAAVADLYGVAIDEYRTVAQELQPGDSDAASLVASEYAQRSELWGNELLNGLQISTDATPAAGGASATPQPQWQQVGSSVLSDVEQVRTWSDQVLNDPNASREAKLRAWGARLTALEWEWTWYVNPRYGADSAKADALLKEMTDAATAAMAYVDSAPSGDFDESDLISTIYVQSALSFGLKNPDDPQVSVLYGKAVSVRQQGNDDRQQVDDHVLTYCTEEREHSAAAAALANNDLAGARQHFEAAIAANPRHVPSLIGLAGVLEQQGDLAGAVAAAQAATQADPNAAAAWEMLGYLQVLTGDAASNGTYQRYVDVLKTYGPQRRMASARAALERLREAIGANPATVPAIRSVVPIVKAFLDSTGADSSGSYQYPELYAAAGEVALFADDAATAQSLLQSAVGLDPHLPAARANLALAIAAQARDVASAASAMAQEVFDPFWQKTVDYTPEKLDEIMLGQLDAYGQRFPDRTDTVALVRRVYAAAIEKQQTVAAGLSGLSYRSPTFAYRVYLQPKWGVTSVSTSATVDILELTNTRSTVAFLGGNGRIAEPKSCIALATEVLTKEAAGAENFAPALGRDNNPYVGSSGGTEAVAYTFDRYGTPSVLYMRCDAAEDASFGLLVVAVVPVALYNQERADVESIMSSYAGPDGDTRELLLPDLAVADRQGDAAA